jgi:SAM-dependent methyltransferase
MYLGSKTQVTMLRNSLRYVRLHLWILPRIHRTYGKLSMTETFQKIYRTGAWGGNGARFSSGSGSYGPVLEQYCAAVIEFIRDHQVQSVLDLGCGDFNVGKRIVEATGVTYTGVDVVPELIEHHKSTVQDPRVSFQCADITTDPLPVADLCLLRQVLQHLSNHEIARVIANLGSFPRTLISEDVPTHPKSFNRDKPHGPDIRSYYGSGVYVEMPPFSVPVVELWNFPLTNSSLLRTALLDQTGSKSRPV